MKPYTIAVARTLPVGIPPRATASRPAPGSPQFRLAIAGLLSLALAVVGAELLLARRAPHVAAPIPIEAEEPAEAPHVAARRYATPAPLAPIGIAAPTPAAEGGEQPPEAAADADRRILEEQMSTLVSSGATHAPWTTKASSVLSAWKMRSSLSDADVTFAAADCYAAGCAVKATYKDFGSFLNVNHTFVGSPDFMEWSGPKYRSGPTTLASGQLEATWIFFAPVD